MRRPRNPLDGQGRARGHCKHLNTICNVSPGSCGVVSADRLLIRNDLVVTQMESDESVGQIGGPLFVWDVGVTGRRVWAAGKGRIRRVCLYRLLHWTPVIAGWRAAEVGGCAGTPVVALHLMGVAMSPTCSLRAKLWHMPLLNSCVESS